MVKAWKCVCLKKNIFGAVSIQFLLKFRELVALKGQENRVKRTEEKTSKTCGIFEPFFEIKGVIGKSCYQYRFKIPTSQSAAFEK